jgi:hypothetical protein
VFWLNNADATIMFPSLGAMLCFAFPVWSVRMKGVEAPSAG